jgi:muramoyltetrapeptide carboxypeptidase
MRIGVVAPSTPITAQVADRVLAIAAADFPDAEVVFHPQCFLSHNHFAGTDADRAAAFLEVANDAAFDALWFARGGYGSCRIAETVLPRLSGPALDKTYLGYSDAGYLLAGLYAAGIGRPVHGPMPGDVRREGGEAAIRRALSWLTRRDPRRWSRRSPRETKVRRSTSRSSASCSARRFSRTSRGMC